VGTYEGYIDLEGYFIYDEDGRSFLLVDKESRLTSTKEGCTPS